ncbi:MAG: hypothetical protein GC145_07710 [Caulobacter sp.]|nr:hypothetical protein [Caulobacter sp.]
MDEESLTSAWHAGTLASIVFRADWRADEEERQAEVDLWVRLHNDHKIDLLSAIDPTYLQSIPGHQFFGAQHLLNDAIPRLQAPLGDMVRAVGALVQAGGSDLAAGSPNIAFQQWCANDTERGAGVVRWAEALDAQAIGVLPYAIVGCHLIEDAVRLMRSIDSALRTAAIVGIGRVKPITEEMAAELIQNLYQVLDDSNDVNVLINSILSALQISKEASGFGSEIISRMISKCAQLDLPEYQLGYTKILWIFGSQLTDGDIAILLGNLQSISPEHRGIVDQLDYALADFLRQGRTSTAIAHLAKVLTNNDIPLAVFDSTRGQLLSGPKDTHKQVVVSWLASGPYQLCEAAGSLLHQHGDMDMHFDVTEQAKSLTTPEQLYLGRHAVGYLVIRPIAATSIILSVLRVCNIDTAEALTSLLFFPLLVNYGGTVDEVLRNLPADDLARPHAELALAESEKYVEGLKRTSNIRELEPPETHRQLENNRFYQEMRSAHKDAMSKSVFFNLVSRSIVLHGNKTLSYRQNEHGGIQSFEMELKSHATSVEWPRLSAIDPIGFDYLIRVLRREGLQE